MRSMDDPVPGNAVLCPSEPPSGWDNVFHQQLENKTTLFPWDQRSFSLSPSWGSLANLEINNCFSHFDWAHSIGSSWRRNCPEVNRTTVSSHSSPTSPLPYIVCSPSPQTLYPQRNLLHIVISLRICLLCNTYLNIQCPMAVTWRDLPWRIKYHRKKTMDGKIEDRNVADNVMQKGCEDTVAYSLILYVYINELK